MSEHQIIFDGSTSLEDVKNYAEKMAIINVMENCNGNKVKMAKLLGISRETLYQKLKKYDLA